MDHPPDKTTIGRYVIESKLGQGGMAEVYAAYDPHFKRRVAIKVLPAYLIQMDLTFAARFQREAETIASLEHPAIVPVHDFGEEDGRPYLVMRLMTGGSLEDRLEKGPLSLKEASEIISRLAPAIDKAHSRNIIHRDIKPGNILFDDEGNAYLADFGIVKLKESTTSFTGQGTIGTAAYMSPEQGLGKRDLDGRADIYSLGAILYHMLTGKLPYDAETPTGQMMCHINEPVPDIGQVLPEASEALQAVIARAMAKNKEDRYGTAQAFAKGLEDAATPAAQKASSPLIEQSKSQKSQPGEIDGGVIGSDQRTAAGGWKLPPRKTLLAWALGALLLCAIGVVGVYGLSGGFAIERTPTAQVQAQSTDNVVAITPISTDVPPTSASTSISTPTITSTRTLTPTLSLGIGSTMISPIDGMVMVYVPEGEFLMGSANNDPYALDDEKPQHTVYLDAFWIDQTEVTNAMYALCVQAGVCDRPFEISYSRDSYYGNPTFDDYPVIHVDWNDANDYCSWAGRQLPTEAQWEKAARGMDGRFYPWGDFKPDCTLANYAPSRGEMIYCLSDTKETGSHPNGASPFGALDMAGNVWEWVADWYEDDYYTLDIRDNPSGSHTGENRVIRGGDWGSDVRSVRAAYRADANPNSEYDSLGFRCSRSK